MKKKFALFLAIFSLLSAAGCAKDVPAEAQPSSGQNIQTEIRLEQCGLAYTVPAEWLETEDANLIPTSFVDLEGEIYAKVQYSFAPGENMAALNDMDSDIPVEELMAPLVCFLVLKEESLETETVREALSLFRSQEELPAQEGFRFYFLTDPVSGVGRFSEAAQETFRTLAQSLPALKESAKTFPPDEASARAAAEENSQYLNFISTTLEGEAVTSAVFYDYDLTVVNFWASYCYPDLNELETLEAFYRELRQKHPNANFVQVLIDTPDEEAERIAAGAYAEADVTFLSILPDQNLAGWIIRNLNGLPTTVFVDRKGKTFPLRVEGMQDAAYYMETTEAMLQSAQAE